MTKRNREAARKVARAPLPPEPLGEPHFTSAWAHLQVDMEPYIARTERLVAFLQAQHPDYAIVQDHNIVRVTWSSGISWDGWNQWALLIKAVCPPLSVLRDEIMVDSAPTLLRAVRILAGSPNPTPDRDLPGPEPITPVDMEAWRAEFETIRQLGALGVEAATWLGMEPIPNWRKP